MTSSVYEQLERDRKRGREEQGVLARMACEHASMRIDLALAKLERIFDSKYRPDQPRVPAGNPGGGRWGDAGGGRGQTPARKPETELDEDSRDRARIILAGGFTKDQLDLTVQDFTSRYCLGSINRVLPGEFSDSTIAEVMAAKRAGNEAADTCLKLLGRNEYRKRR